MSPKFGLDLSKYRKLKPGEVPTVTTEQGEYQLYLPETSSGSLLRFENYVRNEGKTSIGEGKRSTGYIDFNNYEFINKMPSYTDNNSYDNFNKKGYLDFNNYEFFKRY